APGQVGGVDHLLHRQPERVGHAHAAVLGRRGEAAPAAFGELRVRLLEAGRGGDAPGVGVIAHAVAVADLVERRQHAFAKARAFLEDRVDRLAAGILVAELAERGLHPQHVVQGEADLVQRCGITAHRADTCGGRTQRNTPGRPGTGLRRLSRLTLYSRALPRSAGAARTVPSSR